MARYKCAKCGCTGDSKCVHQRSVFPTVGKDSIMSHLIKYTVRRDPTVRRATVNLYQPAPITMSDTEMLTQFLNLIRDMSDQDVKTYACGVHDWKLIDDQCDLGCCKREAK